MKITLPENISEITLGQYQRCLTLIKKDLDPYNFLKQKIQIFTSLDSKTIEAITRKDFEEINAQIDKALNQDAKFEHRFILNDIEFGFVNLQNITQGEYIDLCEYSKDIETGQNLHKLMSVLFRPIIDKGLSSTYIVEPYTASQEYIELMKKAPMNIVNGCLAFFLTLQNDLLNHILKSTEVERVRVAKQQDILQNGVG